MNQQREVKRITTWLRRLAEPEETVAAGAALFEIQLSCAHPEADVEHAYTAAIASLEPELDGLIPAWVDRLIEMLDARNRKQQAIEEARRAEEDLPEDLGLNEIWTADHLVKVLGAVGERIDPHVGPIIKSVGQWGRDEDEKLFGALEQAGPRVRDAVPAMLKILGEHGTWCWPSHLAQALAHASRFDDRVLSGLRKLLASADENVRDAAISVLGLMGERARPAADELLAFRHGTPADRSSIVSALARQGMPTPDVLDLLEAAMRDDDGYVRRTTVYALGERQPDPERFVPLLIEACDYPEYLHDTSLPDAAVKCLGAYGPAARAALPRLRLFLEGPIKNRTAKVRLVREAIERIDPELGRSNDPIPAVPRRPQPPAQDEPLFAVIYRDRRCYVDRRGHIAIATTFRWGKPFSDGRAILDDDDGNSFVIDRRGEIVFESTWDDIKPFHEGLAAVQKDEKWGFVDLEGHVVIEPRFDSVTPFSEGLAGVELGRGAPESLDKVFTVRPAGRYGFINRAGEIVIPAVWISASSFRDGRAVVCTGGVMKPNPLFEGKEYLSEQRHGYIDTAGRLVIDGVYLMAGSFCEGLAAVVKGDRFSRTREGYIDADGKTVIPLTFTHAGSFKDGLALVHRRGKKRRGKSSVIDRAGGIVLEPEFPINSFSEGLSAARIGDDWGFIDLHGNVVIEPQFDQCEPFTNGLAEVQRGDWYGLIDRVGRFVWGPTTEGGVSRVIESEWA